MLRVTIELDKSKSVEFICQTNNNTITTTMITDNLYATVSNDNCNRGEQQLLKEMAIAVEAIIAGDE